MTSQSEPLDVGPIAGGHLPAREADKSQVAALLRSAAAEGRLTQTELDERLTVVRTATTFDDLIPLTRDLVPLAGPETPSADAAEPNFGAAVLGSTDLTPSSAVAADYSMVSVMGSAKLDLTRARFDRKVVEVNAFSIMGDVVVLVPRGVRVQKEAIAVLGDVQEKKLAPALDGAPTVIIRGLVIMGSVTVKHPK